MNSDWFKGEDIFADVFQPQPSSQPVSSPSKMSSKTPHSSLAALKESFNSLTFSKTMEKGKKIFTKSGKGETPSTFESYDQWLEDKSDKIKGFSMYNRDRLDKLTDENCRTNEAQFLKGLIARGIHKETILRHLGKMHRKIGTSVVLTVLDNVFDFQRKRVDGYFFSTLDIANKQNIDDEKMQYFAFILQEKQEFALDDEAAEITDGLATAYGDEYPEAPLLSIPQPDQKRMKTGEPHQNESDDGSTGSPENLSDEDDVPKTLNKALASLEKELIRYRDFIDGSQDKNANEKSIQSIDEKCRRNIYDFETIVKGYYCNHEESSEDEE